MKNVIVLHTDQQRADSLGCMGNPHACTPHIDRLAAGGTVFDRHIVANPICCPSRASLMTGLYPPGHNVWCNGVPLNRAAHAQGIDHRCEDSLRNITFHPEPATIADRFAAAGYDTASFGKLHLTPYMSRREHGGYECTERWIAHELDDWHGPYFGFRHVDLTLGHGEGVCSRGHYGLWLQAEHPEVANRVAESQPERPVPGVDDLYVSTVPVELHNSLWLADQLVSYLDSGRPADQPFFAFVGFPDPHHPFVPCADVVDRFRDSDVLAPIDPEGAAVRGTPLERWSQERLAGVDAEGVRTVRRFTHAMGPHPGRA
jgi:arylsulfatase A-like enzyme